MIKRITTAREKYDNELAKTAKEIAKTLGPLIPPGFALNWTQGTPAFNDGSPCTFSVHEPSLKRMSQEEDNWDEYNDDENDTEDEDLDEDDDDLDENDQETSNYEDSSEEDDSEPDEMELGTALKRFGKKNKRRHYETEDYTRPINGQKDQFGRQFYEKRREYYTEQGFPEIEGYTKKQLKELVKLWDSMPEELLKTVFGDDAEVTIYPNGKFDRDDYYCE